jgi:archaellum biogenesis ATPase FlaH
LYKRLCYYSIVTDKTVIEVIEAKEGLNPFYGVRGFLVTDYFNLLRVNLNSFRTNNKPKILYSFYPKLIFLNINL